MRKQLSLFLAVVMVVALAPAAMACYGAAAIGQGGAYTSHAQGVLAIYWDQAGLAFTDGRGEVSATYTSPQDYINYNAFNGVAVKLGDRWGFGFGQTQTAPWAGGETWNTVAAGYKVTDNIAVGGAIRSVHGQDEWGEYDSTGIDLSAQGRFALTDSTKLNVGFLYQDANGGSEANPWMEKNFRPSVSMETDKLTLGVDLYDFNALSKELEGEPTYFNHQVGIEYRPMGRDGDYALRAGIYQDTVTYGAGLKMGNLFGDLVVIPEWEVVQMTAGMRF